MEALVVRTQGLDRLIRAVAAATGLTLDEAASAACIAYNHPVDGACFSLTADKGALVAEVDEYEPETVWLRGWFAGEQEAAISRILSAYELAWGSGAAFRPLEETRDFFDRLLADIGPF